jgi:uncharacterized protein
MILGYTGLYTVRLSMPWVQSLKEKRALVRPVVERLKARFPVSVARLDGLNDHDFEVIGIVTIHSDYQWIEELLRNVADFIASNGEYQLSQEETSIDVIEASG